MTRVPQPCPRYAPVPLHGRRGNTFYIRNLFKCQPREIPHFDQFGQSHIDCSQSYERGIEAVQVETLFALDARIEFDSVVRSLLGSFGAGIVDEYLSHQRGCERHKMRAVGKFYSVESDQPNDRVIDEVAGRQR